MNKKHCLTAVLAVLLAAPTAVATQTANAQTVQHAAKANAEQVVILNEDFSKMTSGSENNPDLSFNINTCTGMPTNDIFYSCVNPDYTHLLRVVPRASCQQHAGLCRLGLHHTGRYRPEESYLCGVLQRGRYDKRVEGVHAAL